MEPYFSKTQAYKIASDYQWLIGQKFIEPYSGIGIDFIQPKKLSDETYRVVVMINAFSEYSIPEMFGFKNPTCDLFRYLNLKGISYNILL
jgi:hypothetical protein